MQHVLGMEPSRPTGMNQASAPAGSKCGACVGMNSRYVDSSIAWRVFATTPCFLRYRTSSAPWKCAVRRSMDVSSASVGWRSREPPKGPTLERLGSTWAEVEDEEEESCGWRDECEWEARRLECECRPEVEEVAEASEDVMDDSCWLDMLLVVLLTTVVAAPCWDTESGPEMLSLLCRASR